ncbi:MAG: cofactor-independent phosphoglycerate mutase [Clostridia bacterium]|nr:cofactor-independent phosphoglycerate mutase [Clostridia bacterium]
MKYVVILGDGMADYPSKALGGRTPLEVANKPNIDDLCKKGKLGLVKTVPDGMKPGSDVANLSMMGYAPDKYYTGRSPLEALSIGIDLKDTDLAIRCNLVTLSDEENYADKTMLDYSAGEISTEEAKELIEYLQQNLGDEYIDFHAGVSYRHCLVAHNAEKGTDFTPPHDISDKKITEYLPKGEYGDIFLDIMIDSYKLLKDHPVNKKRIENGLKPANSIWLWGEGTRPELTPFEEKYGIKGAVISAVDLIKGIGTGAKMKVINVEGATGTYKTNFQGKAKACIDALKEGYDYVYIHMEAPDECGHQGDADNKIKSIELIDSIVVKYVKEQLDKMNDDYKILIAPDHPTPLSLKTHTSDPVPFIIYSHKAGVKDEPADGKPYSEENGQASGLVFSTGEDLMDEFLHGDMATAANPQQDTQEDKKSEDDKTSDDKVEDKTQDDKKKDKDKQDKPTSPKKKLGKKGIIAIVASVAVVAILLSIILPVVFFHAPRIFVKNADGFNAANLKKNDFGKYFFVLDKNISCNTLTFNDSNLHSIDLNKHTLSVSDKLEITTDKSGTLYIGTRKGKSYVTNKKSNLKAGTLEINAPNMNVVLMANVSCENLTATAKTLTLYNYGGGNTNEVNAEITAEKVTFAGNIVNAKSTSKISIVNCPQVVVQSGVKIANTLELLSSDATVKSKSTVATLNLDSNSTAIVEGNISNTINGGKQVIMKAGHSCPTYQDVKNLIIFRDLNSTHNMSGCDNVIYVEELAKPIDIIIEERSNRIYCKVAKVKYAKSYKFDISGVEEPLIWEKNSTDDPEFDITQYVSTPGRSYTITVTPQGNYDDTLDFEKIGSSTLYVDGASVSVNYNYIITLNMPTGLKVNTITEDETTKASFEFDKVPDATNYKIYVDGKEIKNPAFSENGTNLSVDITQYVNKVGDHSIRVKAVNTNNPNIKDSPDSMIAHSTTEKLNAVDETTITATINEDDNAVIHASWQGVQNGYEYLVELQINGGEKIEIGRTSILKDGRIGYSINFADLTGIVEYDSDVAASNGYVVVITAIGHGYYTDSDAQECVATLPQTPSEYVNSGTSLNKYGFTSGIDTKYAA